MQDLPGPDRLLARRRPAERADGRPRRTASPTASSATPRAPPPSSSRRRGPDAAVRPAPPSSPSAARPCRLTRRRSRRRRRGRRSTSPPAPSSTIGAVDGPGLRATLAVRGGLDVAPYLGQPIDVHARRLRRPRGPAAATPATSSPSGATSTRPRPARCRPAWRRVLATTWEIGVLVGPHAAPEFLTADGLDGAAAARVGGPLQLGPHRRAPRRPPPRLGRGRRRRGRPAPVQHPRHRLRDRRGRPHRRHAGDPRTRRPEPRRLRVPGGRRRAGALEARPARARATASASCRGPPPRPSAADASRRGWRGRPTPDRAGRPPGVEPAARPRRPGATTACSTARAADGDHPGVTYRRAGDRFLLVEYGPMALDLGAAAAGPRPRALGRASTSTRRRRRHRRRALAAGPGRRPTGSTWTTRQRRLPAAEDELGDVDAARRCPSRVVHLPLSWDDPATREAIAALHARRAGRRAVVPRGTSSSSAGSTGSSSVDDVHRIVFDASYLVLGLGDVYLGAPVATPLDPRHRLVTTKYNPARTWTPENAVGIGGAYLCIYGMEGPGGYQFVGRTVQVWNRDRRGPHFDRAVAAAHRSTRCGSTRSTADELLELRAEQAAGRLDDRDRGRRRSGWPTTARFLAGTPTTSTRSAPRSRPRSPPSGAAWADAAGESRAMTHDAVGGGRCRRSQRIAADGRAGRSGSTLVDADAAGGRGAPTSTRRRRPTASDAAARRHDARGQGQHRRRRPADHRRLPGVRLPAAGRRAGRGRARRRRRRRRRQDQPRPVRHRSGRHPLAVRHLPERPLARPDRRRVELRLGGRRGGRAWSTSPSAPTPPARAGCRRRATASSALKPTRGRISTGGVVPACRSLDCVSVFARRRRDGGAGRRRRRRARSRRPVEPAGTAAVPSPRAARCGSACPTPAS